METAICYEQSVNELMRSCLRLSNCFNICRRLLDAPSRSNHHTAIQSLTLLTSLLDRPDLRGKLIHELQRQFNQLAKLENVPNVDPTRLQAFLCELTTVIQQLQSLSGKSGQALRNNKFLPHIQQQLDNQSGLSPSDIPELHAWLNFPVTVQSEQLQSWVQSCDIILNGIKLLLQLARQNQTFQDYECNDGFYEKQLDPGINWQLIRVKLTADATCFPQISVGRHRLCIQFMQISIDGEICPFNGQIQFALACCAL